MNFTPETKPLIKLITAGEETALEDKVNAYFVEHPDHSLVDLQVSQTTYHTRLGTTESGMMAVIVVSVKR